MVLSFVLLTELRSSGTTYLVGSQISLSRTLPMLFHPVLNYFSFCFSWYCAFVVRHVNKAFWTFRLSFWVSALSKARNQRSLLFQRERATTRNLSEKIFGVLFVSLVGERKHSDYYERFHHVVVSMRTNYEEDNDLFLFLLSSSHLHLIISIVRQSRTDINSNTAIRSTPPTTIQQ